MSQALDVIVIGSLNVDHVYRVPRIVRPGETISSANYLRTGGGKGLNQSIALARAGVSVAHVGKVGRDGVWLLDLLAADGVDTSRISISSSNPTGHALIQIDQHGENAIVVCGGANRELETEDVRAALVDSGASWMLAQNETNSVHAWIALARAAGMKLALNPAPMTEEIASAPLEALDLLVVNEIEGLGLSVGKSEIEILEHLQERCPHATIALTLGVRGALLMCDGRVQKIDSVPVEVVDTTAAGDTFVGYLLAGLVRGVPPEEAARVASHAAAVAVTRPGAAASIPWRDELQRSAFRPKL